MSQYEKLLLSVLSGRRDGNILMHKYETIIYWSAEDNRYIAEVPELAGCMADGATMEDALKNVAVIVEEWIETANMLGREIPKPKGKLAYA